MRIIAGRHRGRRLLSPPASATTRPITDRVKESVFGVLASRGVLEGAAVLDLFAGTGTLGLEALSRGASRCVFVERDARVRAMLWRNVEAMGESANAAVLGGDALGPAAGSGGATLVFCDPPYAMVREGKGLARVGGACERLAVAAGCVLVLRLPTEVGAPALAGWDGPEPRRYGSMAVHLYERAAGAS